MRNKTDCYKPHGLISKFIYLTGSKVNKCSIKQIIKKFFKYFVENVMVKALETLRPGLQILKIISFNENGSKNKFFSSNFLRFFS